ncbi:methyl-accepting chemotaxis protein [Bacteriovorax sp. Seq25_V]|uniref:methyl-accepting chemotaxis protein n=1 Tax=Bacteriovorax sp. Seq25_V TaxID=1201288 RepID=UPI000389E114|nr:methyl-accepting chemotaxis protein [Bacteriovorax sp. Seq25_V]EQC46616.1 methyl-accepting chemotaxis protein signaling domain protein [Bacteriovorax sp. Seq25_V]
MSLQVKILLFLCFIFSFLGVSVIYTSSQNNLKFVEHVIVEQTDSIADQYFDSINTLMITGSMDEREVLRKKYLDKNEILEAKIIRSDIVIKDFGNGYEHERASNEIEKKSLEGKSVSDIFVENGKRQVWVYKPFRASSNYKGTNCLECHVSAKEGDILGASVIKYDLSSIDNEIAINSRSLTKMMIAIFVISLVILFIVIRVLIVKRIKKIASFIQTVERDLDLTVRVRSGIFKDEISVLASSFNKMLDSIHYLIQGVSDKTSTISDGAITVQENAVSTFNVVNKQEVETQSVSAAITEMAESAKMVAINCRDASDSVEKALESVSHGVSYSNTASEKISLLQKTILEVGAQMTSLEKSGSEILEVLNLIHDITMKTQHLSINAAVEAARAGEHGKGFVVVAEEIGELARETKTSTEKIKSITESINKLIEHTAQMSRESERRAIEGVASVKDSEMAFNQISEQIENANRLTREIETATSEQSTSADSIHKSICEIIELNKEATLSAQEISKIGTEFSNLANDLKNDVDKFRC